MRTPRLLIVGTFSLATLVLVASVFLVLNRNGVVLLRGSALLDAGLALNHRFVRPLPVGQEWIVWDFGIANTSRSSLRIREITLPGPGMGRVVAVQRIELENAGSPLVVAGTYGIHPPAQGCRVASLRSPTGVRLGAGASVRISVWLRTVAPGRFRYQGYSVVYEQDGRVYEQLLEVGQSGRVAVDGHVPNLSRGAPCTRDRVTPLANGEPRTTRVSSS